MERRRQNIDAVTGFGRQDLSSWSAQGGAVGAPLVVKPAHTASAVATLQTFEALDRIAMLDDSLKSQLQSYLQNLRHPIRLVASLDESDKSQELHQLLRDIAALSDKVSVDTTGNDARKPSFMVAKEGESRGVRFAAIPMGHEFTSLVLALLWTGGHPPKVEPAVVEQIKHIDTNLKF